LPEFRQPQKWVKLPSAAVREKLTAIFGEKQVPSLRIAVSAFARSPPAAQHPNVIVLKKGSAASSRRASVIGRAPKLKILRLRV